jgi:hypothetical protein
MLKERIVYTKYRYSAQNMFDEKLTVVLPQLYKVNHLVFAKNVRYKVAAPYRVVTCITIQPVRTCTVLYLCAYTLDMHYSSVQVSILL